MGYKKLLVLALVLAFALAAGPVRADSPSGTISFEVNSLTGAADMGINWVAKFIHITRNPYAVYLSFHRNWRLGHAHSHLQKTDPLVIDELILSWYTELFALFERDRRLIPPGDLHELRFEDLEKSPRECLANLYQGLSLPDFERFWQQASVYLDSIADY